MAEPLIVAHRGPVDWVTLNRPDRLNALNFALVDAVRDYFEGLRRNRDTRMLATSPLGLRMSKEALNLSLDAPSLDAALAVEDRHQALLSNAHDAKEAIDAFPEKRPPRYEDR